MPWSERIRRRFKLRDLHILLAVARMGSMGRAAAALSISQPAVSKAITDLEQALDVRLFERTRQGTEPTSSGRALLKAGIAVFDVLRQGLEEMDFLSDPTVGELRIGCHEPLITGFVATVIDELTRRFPRVTVQVMPGDAVSLNYALHQRDIELTIVPTLGLEVDRDTEAEVLFDDRHVIVAAAISKWARRRKMMLTELEGEPWVLPPAESIAGRYIDDAFRSAGLEPPSARVSSFSIPLHHHLLATGRYVTSLPRSLLQFAPHLQLKQLPIAWPAKRRPVAILTLKSRALSPLAESFAGQVRQFAKSSGLAH